MTLTQISSFRRPPGEAHNETVVDAGSAEPLRPTAVSPSRRRPGQPGFV